MTKVIKLSDIRKWKEAAELTQGAAQIIVSALGGPSMMALGLESTTNQAVLQFANRDVVQKWSGWKWIACLSIPGNRARDTTYRLNRNCTVVDDTERWKEVEVEEDNGQWWIGPTTTLRMAIDRTTYVCLKVRDAEGREWYIPNWRGSRGWIYGWLSLEEFTQQYSDTVTAFKRTETMALPLTPIAVVFDKAVAP